MAKARDIQRRIGSIKSTRKITRTMEMVATSKLRRATQRVEQARPYAAKLQEVIERLVTPDLVELRPILRQPERIERAAVVLITSNRGLCGAFNTNLIRTARDLLDRAASDGIETDLHVVGRKGVNFFRFRGVRMASERTDIGDAPTAEDARSIIEPVALQFVAGVVDAVFLVYSEFRSILRTPPVARQILPVFVPEERVRSGPWYILYPSADEILSRLLPLYVVNAGYRALVETAAAEQGARRTAMKNATDNADELTHTLTRLYNRARQAEITQQIAEIMGGAEALVD
jgi:F-type H+-transporting ATPase subunit gamma